MPLLNLQLGGIGLGVDLGLTGGSGSGSTGSGGGLNLGIDLGLGSSGTGTGTGTGIGVGVDLGIGNGTATGGTATGTGIGVGVDLGIGAGTGTGGTGTGTGIGVGVDIGVGLPVVPLLFDTVPDDTSSNVTLTVGAAPTIGTINLPGDEDFFRVELVAGQTYSISMVGVLLGPSILALADSYIRIYDSAGNLLDAADGGANTLLNVLNPDLDVLTEFTARQSGTYFISASAFDNIPIGTGNGELIGDYQISIGIAPPSDDYYDPNSPLASLDTGEQVDGTVRNPDGNDGPRPTGNPQGTPNPTAPDADVPGKNVISVYFAEAGDLVTTEGLGGLPGLAVAAGTTQAQQDAVWLALEQFENVADVVYVEVDSAADADFVFATYNGTSQGQGTEPPGSMAAPNDPNEGVAVFNLNDPRFTEVGLNQGGYTFTALLHHFGHGHGLAHPFGGDGTQPLAGVTPIGSTGQYTTGDFDFNQGIYTMMSNNQGWATSPYGQAAIDSGYGYLGGLSAFDIAVIQEKYGVNQTHNAGDTLYTLKDENAIGTFFSSIWDTGGVDTIAYSGARNAHIDLRAATLEYEAGGGGRVSYASGIYGGFTIANAVVIENARGGSGNDTLIGNNVANRLDGGAGDDNMAGHNGDDTYIVGSAGDQVVEQVNEGRDTVYASVNHTLAANVEDLYLEVGVRGIGNALNNLIVGNAISNNLDGGAGHDRLFGRGGDDYLFGAGGHDTIEGEDGNDKLLGAAGNDKMLGGNGNDLVQGGDDADALFGGSGLDTLEGGDGNDYLSGNGGNDQLYGGDGVDKLIWSSGNDAMYGGRGGDRFIYVDEQDGDFEAGGRAGTIFDFSRTEGDKIDLSDLADNLQFIGTGAFTGGGAQVRYTGTSVQVDTDGDRQIDLYIRVSNTAEMIASDFIL